MELVSFLSVTSLEELQALANEAHILAKINIESKWRDGKRGHGGQAVPTQWNSFSIRSALLLGM